MDATVAWLLWGAVHITYLIGFRNRAAVALNWLWAWVTYAKGARLITGRDPAPEGAAERAARERGHDPASEEAAADATRWT